MSTADRPTPDPAAPAETEAGRGVYARQDASLADMTESRPSAGHRWFRRDTPDGVDLETEPDLGSIRLRALDDSWDRAEVRLTPADAVAIGRALAEMGERMMAEKAT